MIVTTFHTLIPLFVTAALGRATTLEAGLRHVTPWLPPAAAAEQVWGAMAHETHDFPAELMLGKAIGESGFENRSTPQCGVLQVHLGPAACAVASSSAAAGYAAGAAAYAKLVVECRRWRVRNVQRCVLNYYAEGWRAGRAGYGVKCKDGRSRCDRGALARARAWRIATYATRHARTKPSS